MWRECAPCAHLLPDAVALFLLAQAHSGAVLLLSGLFLGLGFGNFQSVGQAVSLAMVTRSRFAQATTTCFILFDLGVGAGPWLFGHLVSAFGFGACIWPFPQRHSQRSCSTILSTAESCALSVSSRHYASAKKHGGHDPQSWIVAPFVYVRGREKIPARFL